MTDAEVRVYCTTGGEYVDELPLALRDTDALARFLGEHERRLGELLEEKHALLRRHWPTQARGLGASIGGVFAGLQCAAAWAEGGPNLLALGALTCFLATGAVLWFALRQHFAWQELRATVRRLEELRQWMAAQQLLLEGVT